MKNGQTRDNGDIEHKTQYEDKRKQKTHPQNILIIFYSADNVNCIDLHPFNQGLVQI